MLPTAKTLLGAVPLGLAILAGACGPHSGAPDGRVRLLPEVRPAAREYLVAQPLAKLCLPGPPRSLRAEGAVLYAFMNQSGLATIDIGDPRAPTVVQCLPGMNVAADQPGHMFLDGIIEPATTARPARLLAVDRAQGGIAVFGLEDPRRPRLEWIKRVPGGLPVHLGRAGDHYYVAAGGLGLLRMPADFGPETPLRPVLRQWDEVKQTHFLPPHWLLVADSEGGGMQVVDLSDPERPRPRRTFHVGSFCDVVLPLDGRVWTNNRYHGAMVLDMGDPLEPAVAAVFPARLDLTRCLTRYGDHGVLVGNALGYFDVMDWQPGGRPTWLARVLCGGSVNAMVAVGDVVYVALDRAPLADAINPIPQLEVYRLERHERS